MKEKQVYVRVSKELHKSVALLSIEKGISRNEIMLQALSEYVKKTNEVKPC